MAWRKPDPELVALFGTMIPTDPRIERRTMFGCPAALANGALFGCVHQESFLLKLNEQDRATMRDKFDAHGYEFRPGRGVHDFVAMPDEILDDRRALGEWITRAIDYVAAKKPAPGAASKKKAPAAKRPAARKRGAPA